MLINYFLTEEGVRIEDPLSYIRVTYYEEEFADKIIELHKKLNKDDTATTFNPISY